MVEKLKFNTDNDPFFNNHIEPEEQGLYVLSKAYKTIELADGLDVSDRNFDTFKTNVRNSTFKELTDGQFAHDMAYDDDLRYAFNSFEASNPSLLKDDVNDSRHTYNRIVAQELVRTAGYDDLTEQQLDGVSKYAELIADQSEGLGDVLDRVEEENPDIRSAVNTQLPEINAELERYSEKSKEVVKRDGVHANTMSGSNIGVYATDMKPFIYTTKHNEVKTGVLIDPIKRADLADQHNKYDGAHVVNTKGKDGKVRHYQMIGLETTNKILGMHGQKPLSSTELQDKALHKESLTNNGQAFAINGNIFHPNGKKYDDYVLNPNPDKLSLGPTPIDMDANKKAEQKYATSKAVTHQINKDKGPEI